MSVRIGVSMTVVLGLFVVTSCQSVQDKEKELTAQCKRDWPCKKSGLCTGKCTPEPCVCAAVAPADCTSSTDCNGVGQCTPKDGRCVVATNSDCAHVAACKATGVCTAKDGTCVVGSDADCAQADICKDQHKCAMKAGACIDANFNPALLEPNRAGETAPDKYKAKFVTAKGEFTVEVTRAWAPFAADRFYNLVKIGYYNDSGVYRVNDTQAEFGVHGNPEVSAAWFGMKMKDEPNKQSNEKGTLVFPRPYPTSRWAPIVINLKDNRDLDKVGSTPFGKIISGMNVVEAFAKNQGDGAPPGSKPPELEKVIHGGNEFLKKNFPQMEFIKAATLM